MYISTFLMMHIDMESFLNGFVSDEDALGLFITSSDISELNLAKTTSISFPNGKDDLLNFEITIRPDEGYYM